MKVHYNPSERQETLDRRGLDFEDIRQILAGFHIHIVHDVDDLGEERFTSVGYVDDEIVACLWMPRDDAKYVLGMRLADDDEKGLYRLTMEKPE